MAKNVQGTPRKTAYFHKFIVSTKLKRILMVRFSVLSVGSDCFKYNMLIALSTIVHYSFPNQIPHKLKLTSETNNI